MRSAIILTTLLIATSLHAETPLPGGWVLESMQTLGTPQQEVNIRGVAQRRNGVMLTGTTTGSLGGPIAGQGDVFAARMTEGSEAPDWAAQWETKPIGRPVAITSRWFGGVRLGLMESNPAFPTVKRLDSKGHESWSVQFPAGEVMFGLTQDAWGCSSVLTSIGGSSQQLMLHTLSRNGCERSQHPIAFEPGLKVRAYSHSPGRNGSHILGLAVNSETIHRTLAVAMCDKKGKVKWTWRAEPTFDAMARDVISDKQGRVYLLAKGLFAHRKDRLYVLSPEGRQLAMTEFDGPSSAFELWDVVPRPEGGAYVATTAYGAPTQLMLYILDASFAVTSATILDPRSQVFVDDAWLDRDGRLVLIGSNHGELFGEKTRGKSDAFIVRLRTPQK